MENQSAARIWEAVLGQLQLQVTRPNYDTFLKDTEGLRFEDGHFVIGTGSDFSSQWLTSKLRPLIAKTVSTIVGRPLEVSFELMPSSNGDDAAASPLFQAGDPAKRATVSPPAPKPQLNEKFTFESFVVGDCNRLATASALAAAEQPGNVYNPLFLYGAVGLGKTHLLHAIGHRAHRLGTRLVYVSSERFTNEFITAIAQARLNDFRLKYRSAEILLIDDIQFLAGKERTQEEFFYTFNDLHAAGCQLVITSDRPPGAIGTLEPRLRSRFQWGLIADLQAPCLETRLAILQAKACDRRIDLPQEVAHILAERVQDNVRDLEGCLNRVIAFSSLLRSPITPDVVNQALSALNTPTHSPSSALSILKAVKDYFHLTAQDLTGKSRAKPVVEARHIAMFLLREDANRSLKEIGDLLGHRDHSTVIHACQKIQRFLRKDPRLKAQLTEIRSLLNTN